MSGNNSGLCRQHNGRLFFVEGIISHLKNDFYNVEATEVYDCRKNKREPKMSETEQTSIERIYITETISYIPASKNPLSADVGIIEGEEYLYLFDVGNNEEVAAYLNALPKKKKIILSHFHADHTGSIGRIGFEAVYAGPIMGKYYQYFVAGYEKEEEPEKYLTVTEPMKICDGVELEIHSMPSSHAKGSLLLQVNKEYIFLGDGIYSRKKDGKAVYNVQLLKEQMKLLEELPGEKLFLSHEKRPVKGKKSMIKFLEKIYEKREKNNPYIAI